MTATSSEIMIDDKEIADSLYLHDKKQYPYIVNRVADICLTKFVELIFRNKFGDPLRLQPFQSVMLDMMWNKKFPMALACRGAGKTFMIAVYCLLKTLLIPGSRVVIVSGGFRQAKFTFQYMDELIKASPILQEAIRKNHPGNAFGVKFATDKVYLKVGTNTDITGIPIGDGTKVRGMRATCLICDEVASIDDHVFDTAIGPFLSVQADPSEAVMVEEFLDKLKRMGADPGVIQLVEDSKRMKGNQLILTGTATYQFNHFYRRYEAYKLFAESKGDRKLIKAGLQIQSGEAKIAITDEQLDLWETLYKEYAIFRLPYDAMPKGFLDAAIIATHRAIMDPVIFGHEYECAFSKDSNGFFPRSIVDLASPGKIKDGEERKEDEVHYELYGDPHAVYVMGLDPARHNDNFGLVVLKIENRTAKCVYVDAWDKTDWIKSIKKIREVLHRFPNVQRIAMDSGGGGDTVRDLLANAKMLKQGERPIIDIEPEAEHRAIPDAVRILEMINFHTWSAPANHALRSDIILKNVMFPGRVDDDVIMFRHAKLLKEDSSPFDVDDPKDVQLMEHINDLLYGVDDDEGSPISLGNVRETQAMVDELCTIVQTVTEKGSETFGLQKLSDQPEGLDIRRRDRYSALLLAAHAAREVMGHGLDTGYGVAGGSPGMVLGQRKHGGGRYRPMQNRGGIVY